jgi:microcystin-dependent protein
MSSVIFSNAQRIISAIFDWLQSSAQDKTANFITDTFSSGIDNATTAGEGFTLVPGTSSLSVTVEGQGIAYDSTAQRIFLSASDVTLYNPANLTQKTNDGLDNLLPTPQSSGCVNIPLTPNSFNYLWIDYLPTINVAAFTTDEITNAKIFYEQTDGYNITVTTVNVPPDANSIFLGTVNLTSISSGIIPSSAISQLGRTYMHIDAGMVPITTPFNNGSNRAPFYAQNSTYTLDAHIKSIGTGTGVSPTNPHNMSLTDLGVSVLDTVQEHRLLEHSGGGSTSVAANAIIAGVPGTPYPSTTAMAQSINIVDPGSDTLNIYAMTSTEFAIVNGSAFNTNTIFGAIPTNATVSFPAASGTYDVYWDSVAQVFGVSLTDISTDITKLWIATVTYTVNFTPGYNHLSSLTDRRRIGSTTHLLQRWSNNSRPGAGSALNPQSGEFGFNISTGLIEYWDGTAWQQPVNASSNSFVPTGTLLPFAGGIAPSGFLLSNGASVSTVTYSNLFAVIGYTYGGSGASFNLPQMAGFVPAGTGGSLGLALGGTTGATTASDTVTPTENEHDHISPISHSVGAIDTANGEPGSGIWPYGSTTINSVDRIYATAGDGGVGNYPFLNTSPTIATINPVTVTVATVQPSIGVNYIIKY